MRWYCTAYKNRNDKEREDINLPFDDHSRSRHVDLCGPWFSWLIPHRKPDWWLRWGTNQDLVSLNKRVTKHYLLTLDLTISSKSLHTRNFSDSSSANACCPTCEHNKSILFWGPIRV
jgi:hypothetical protein